MGDNCLKNTSTYDDNVTAFPYQNKNTLTETSEVTLSPLLSEFMRVKGIESQDFTKYSGDYELHYIHIEKPKGGDGKMDDKYLEMYIQKIDSDQDQLRNDIRASEERTSKLIAQSEERTEKHLDRIADSISEINSKLDTKIQDLENKIDSNNKHIQNITYANMGVIGAVIALILTVVFKFF